MSRPLFSVCEITTFHASYEEDLAIYVEAGVDGIGVCEFKLPPDDQDDGALSALRRSGLAATICVPATSSILPLPLSDGPEDPAERVEAICTSIRRLARFEPVACLCLTGPSGSRRESTARRIVVDGLRSIARTATEVGIKVGVEPIHTSIRDCWSIISTLPDTFDLLEDVGESNLGIIYDVWHLWDTPKVLEHTRKYAEHLVGVHVNDWRNPTRSWSDRALPGKGMINLPAILGTLDAGGYDGWYDLELFSDNGVFGDDYDDSLWKRPAVEVVRAGRTGFMRAWNQRRTESSAEYDRASEQALRKSQVPEQGGRRLQ